MEPATTSNIVAAFNAEVDKCRQVNYRDQVFYHPVARIKDWMLADSNVEKLLKHAYPGQFGRPRSGNIKEQLVVFAILLRLGHGKWIHVFQEYFNDNNLDNPITEPLATRFKDHPGVLDDFDTGRWAFNPAKLEDIRNHSKAYMGGRWILPFCRRIRVGKGGTAVVDSVNVCEDFVPDAIKAALLKGDPTRSYEFPDKEFGMCYQFVIKSYPSVYHSVFETETSNFNGMKGLEGVVECFGWYTEESMNGSRLETTHNILMEYGDQDLEEYMALRAPPVRTSEIIEIWESVFELATTINQVHNFLYEDPDGSTEDFSGWHGDIKPSNILFSQGRFKLADFGFARFELKLPGKLPETSLNGVTYTYGAPECDPGRLRKKTKTPHTQKIDTWSFGCLLSSVATWVVLGYDAYRRYYPFIRQHAIETLIKTKEISEAPKAFDGFHDGERVLKHVKLWHQELVKWSKKSDTITSEVLHLVESDMLRSSPADRSSFDDLTRDLRRIIQKAKKELAGLPLTDPQVLEALLILDDMTPPDVNLQARLSNESAPYKLRVLGLDDEARNKRAKKTERIEEMVPPLRVAGRRNALLMDLNQQNHAYTPLSVTFEPAGPPDHIVRHAPSIHIYPPSPPVAPDSQLGSRAEEEPPATGASEDTLVLVHSPEENHASVHADGGLPALDEPLNLGDANIAQSLGQTQDFSTAVNASPQSREPSPPGYPDIQLERASLLTRSATTTVHGTSGFYQSRIGRLRNELEKQWSKRGVFDKMLGRIPVDGVLKTFVQGRDIKFLVDNGWSMLEHWSIVKDVLVTLAMRVGALDDDGLDLLFTRGGMQEERIKGSNIRTRFAAAMSKVLPCDGSNLSRSRHLFPTQMATALQQILTNHRTDTPKRLTIILLTTGVWEHEDDPEDVEKLLAREVGEMAKDPSFCRDRRLTIQFVSFGEDPDGLTRLKNLDDNFSVKYGIPDVIDTEPWQGDPDKMLLGSISSSMDQQVTSSADYLGGGAVSAYTHGPDSTTSYKVASLSPRRTVAAFLGNMTKKSTGGFRPKSSN